MSKLKPIAYAVDAAVGGIVVAAFYGLSRILLTADVDPEFAVQDFETKFGIMLAFLGIGAAFVCHFALEELAND